MYLITKVTINNHTGEERVETIATAERLFPARIQMRNAVMLHSEEIAGMKVIADEDYRYVVKGNGLAIGFVVRRG